MAKKRQSVIGEVKRELQSVPSRVLAFAIDKYKGLKRAVTSITIEKRDIARTAICIGLTVLFILLETTLFSVFKPFGVTPALTLCLVSAIGMSEGGGWGGTFGIIAGIITDAMCETSTTLNPLIFCLVGYFSGLLLEEYFSDMLTVRGVMIAGTAVVRFITTLITAASVLPGFSFGEVAKYVLFPEFFATLLFGALPHAAAYYSLKWAHKVKTLTGK